MGSGIRYTDEFKQEAVNHGYSAPDVMTIARKQQSCLNKYRGIISVGVSFFRTTSQI